MSKVSDIYQKHLAEAKALYQSDIDREIAQLEAQLAALGTKQERLDAECERTSGSVTNPAGEIGGVRSRSKKRKQQMFDRWTQQALDASSLRARKQQIEIAIKNKRGYIQRKASEDAANEILRSILRPGDSVSVPWSDRGTVVRVNQKSVTVKTALTQECVPWGQIGLHDWEKLAEERL